jgi:hypothetical protein
VSALDSANAGMRKQSSARVTVLVEDVNDNDPLFEMVEKEIWFDENEPAGTRVIRQAEVLLPGPPQYLEPVANHILPSQNELHNFFSLH